jgi:hypothetical protein
MKEMIFAYKLKLVRNEERGRLCGLVVIVPGYGSRGPSSISSSGSGMGSTQPHEYN